MPPTARSLGELGCRREGWPRIQLWGARATAAATGFAGAMGIVTAGYALRGSAPSLAPPFAITGIGLVVAAILMVFGARAYRVEIILGGLAGGSFGVTLADMSAQAATIDPAGPGPAA
jgi:hypothetical protein